MYNDICHLSIVIIHITITYNINVLCIIKYHRFHCPFVKLKNINNVAENIQTNGREE